MDDSFFDLHVIRNFFEPEACRRLLEEMRSAPMSLAPTYGKGDAAVDERVRRVQHVSVSRESVASVACRLEDHREAIAEHFRVNLNGFEEPQFLCYRVGDFFVAHQDGNTGLVQLESDRTRRVSVSIFLNQQSEQHVPDAYGGGSLTFSDWRTDRKYTHIAEAGALVAFRSETTHEVTPVTFGQRYSIVSWYR